MLYSFKLSPRNLCELTIIDLKHHFLSLKALSFNELVKWLIQTENRNTSNQSRLSHKTFLSTNIHFQELDVLFNTIVFAISCLQLTGHILSDVVNKHDKVVFLTEEFKDEKLKFSRFKDLP